MDSNFNGKGQVEEFQNLLYTDAIIDSSEIMK